MNRLHNTSRLQRFGSIVGVITLLATLVSVSSIAQATVSTPSEFLYEGRLLDTSRNPITTNVTLRFSFWKSGDWSSSDASGSTLNTSATNFGGWYETQSITPNENGIISARLGSITPLPAITLEAHRFLQVEVKNVGDPDSAYQLLDPTGDDGADSDDRKFIASVPYAETAQTLQGHSIGTGSGDVLMLGPGGTLSTAQTGSGTYSNIFTIDADNSSSTDITLEFGDTLGKTLKFDQIDNRFEFNGSVQIQGDLTVTGNINGINLSSLAAGNANLPLQTTSGAGLTANISGGSYRVDGNITDFTGSSSLALRDNTENYVFFTSTGLTASGSFPTNVSFIPVAKVTTSGGAVTSITDRRVMMSDDRQDTIKDILHPAYAGVSFQADASDNTGQLSLASDSITGLNYYKWTSTKASLNDYDVLVRYTLPLDFQRWRDSLTFQYRSTSASATDNKLDIQVIDTNGTPVTLSGSSTNLASTSWTTAHIEFSGTPMWTPGQTVLLKLHLSSKDSNQIHLGDITFDYINLKRE